MLRLFRMYQKITTKVKGNKIPNNASKYPRRVSSSRMNQVLWRYPSSTHWLPILSRPVITITTEIHRDTGTLLWIIETRRKEKKDSALRPLTYSTPRKTEVWQYWTSSQRYFSRLPREKDVEYVRLRVNL